MASADRRQFTRAEGLPELGQVLEFMRLIWQVDHALQRTSKRMETTLGVTGPQRFVIRIVGRFPGIPAGQLAKLLHLHPSTLTGILQRLEQRGLLRRHSDPRDARRTLLGLTEKGRSFDVDSAGTVEACVAQVFDRMTAQKIGAAGDVLAQIAELLGRSVSEVPALPRSRARARVTRRTRRR
jgi:DNA-binding MarR family transcriptional regulator